MHGRSHHLFPDLTELPLFRALRASQRPTFYRSSTPEYARPLPANEPWLGAFSLSTKLLDSGFQCNGHQSPLSPGFLRRFNLNINIRVWQDYLTFLKPPSLAKASIITLFNFIIRTATPGRWALIARICSQFHYFWTFSFPDRPNPQLKSQTKPSHTFLLISRRRITGGLPLCWADGITMGIWALLNITMAGRFLIVWFCLSSSNNFLWLPAGQTNINTQHSSKPRAVRRKQLADFKIRKRWHLML